MISHMDKKINRQFSCGRKGRPVPSESFVTRAQKLCFSLTQREKKSKIYKVKPNQNNHTVPIKISYGKIVTYNKNISFFC